MSQETSVWVLCGLLIVNNLVHYLRIRDLQQQIVEIRAQMLQLIDRQHEGATVMLEMAKFIKGLPEAVRGRGK